MSFFRFFSRIRLLITSFGSGPSALLSQWPCSSPLAVALQLSSHSGPSLTAVVLFISRILIIVAIAHIYNVDSTDVDQHYVSCSKAMLNGYTLPQATCHAVVESGCGSSTCQWWGQVVGRPPVSGGVMWWIVHLQVVASGDGSSTCKW